MALFSKNAELVKELKKTLADLKEMKEVLAQIQKGL